MLALLSEIISKWFLFYFDERKMSNSCGHEKLNLKGSRKNPTI